MVQQDVLLSRRSTTGESVMEVRMGTSESLQAGSPAESLDVTEVLRSRDAPFVVVGVGASAGGLEALSDLLANLPEKTGMAFVLVQHLDPQHESRLTDLLSRATDLPVLEATHGLAVQPTTSTSSPMPDSPSPRASCSYAARRIAAPTCRSITCSESLAEDQQSAAIGVVLSGTGSDGTLGLEEIKAVGGITFAQDEKSAKHPGMPQSAARQRLRRFRPAAR